jgi:hypothetical protein
VPRQKAGPGSSFGRRSTRQNRVREFARDATTGRHQGLEGRVRLVRAREQPSDSVRALVDARAWQSLCPQEGDGLVPIAAAVLQVGGRTAQDGEEAAEPLGKRFARPGSRHGYPKTVDMVQREGPWSAVMVRGVKGQDGHHLARAQANTAGNPPDEPVTQGLRSEGEALEQAGRFDADDREAHAPMEARLRTRRFGEAKGPSAETQATSDGAQSTARHQKELESKKTSRHLRPGDKSLGVVRTLTQRRLRLGDGLRGSVPLGGDAGDLFARVALSVTSWLGFGLPRISTVGDLRKLPHHARARPSPWPQAMGEVEGCEDHAPLG